MNGYKFSNKKIIILSTEKWEFLYLSKHHYALELSKNNIVYFFNPPTFSLRFKFNSVKLFNDRELYIIQYSFLAPIFIKFHCNFLYRYINKYYLIIVLSRLTDFYDVCIDFGWHQLVKLSAIPSKLKIFFPVDDTYNLFKYRIKADIILTISPIIFKKLSVNRKNCFLLNHGLSDDFVIEAKRKLSSNELSYKNNKSKISVGYAGNLFNLFLDREILKNIIKDNSNVEFYFFGSTHFKSEDKTDKDWLEFLTTAENVQLKGKFKPKELCENLNNMDALILAYKPDNIFYHSDNTHKMLEYLSTGLPIFSTYISIYSNYDFIYMSPENNNNELKYIFEKCIYNLTDYEKPALKVQRIKLALHHTYKKNIFKIEEIISEVI